MVLEQQVKELAIVGLVTAGMSVIGFLLFLNHHLFYASPQKYVAMVYCWILLMYLMYIRKLAQWIVKKEMGIQMDYDKELKVGRG